MFKRLKHKIQRWWIKFRLQPIRVFCFHQVSETFDASTMWECDWMPVARFKNKIGELIENGYTFISLPEAQMHLRKDAFRSKKYAVLTMDDAGNCIMELMPWLAEHNIPITLFLPYSFISGENVNHKCGISLTEVQLNELLQRYPELVSIANHGFNHNSAAEVSVDEIISDIEKDEAALKNYAIKIPFYAYPGGYHTLMTDTLIPKMGLTPVYCDGKKNYNDSSVIHRELL